MKKTIRFGAMAAAAAVTVGVLTTAPASADGIEEWDWHCGSGQTVRFYFWHSGVATVYVENADVGTWHKLTTTSATGTTILKSPLQHLDKLSVYSGSGYATGDWYCGPA